MSSVNFKTEERVLLFCDAHDFSKAMIMHHRGIAVTEDVRRKIGSRYRLERLPDVKVKWSDNPIVVWEVCP